MALEIERKFLVNGTAWKAGAIGMLYRQGYLSTNKERTVRVRVVGDRGVITVKGLTVGARRAEFEYDIPASDAAIMLDDLCEKPLIEKTRYKVEHAGLTWEIDEFLGDNLGLVVAEVELEREDAEVPLPPWAGREVTGDKRYFNSNLVAHPFSTWPK